MKYIKSLIKKKFNFKKDKLYFNDSLKEYIVISSYPRSGNRFLQNIINYCLNEDKTLLNVPFPELSENINISDLATVYDNSDIKFIKSHLFWNQNHKRCIFLYRDGRDSLTSYWRRAKHKKGYKKGITEFIIENFNGKHFPSSWSDYNNAWIDAKNSNKKQIYPIAYESIIKNGQKEIKKMFSFFNINISDSLIKKSLEINNFYNEAKRLEKKQTTYRFGKPGQWKKYFSKEDNELFLKLSKPTLLKLNYKI